MVIDDGGPAFPNEGENTPEHPIYDGMSLRDYFAAAALTGMMANPRDWEEAGASELAEFAFQHADNMLAARRDMGRGE